LRWKQLSVLHTELRHTQLGSAGLPAAHPQCRTALERTKRACGAADSAWQRLLQSRRGALPQLEPPPSCDYLLSLWLGPGFTPRRWQVISYTKHVLGQPVLFTHNAMPRCTFSYGSDFRATPATVESSTTLKCRTPRAAIIGCYSLRVSLDICDFEATIQASCPSERLNSGASYSFIPKRQYPGYTTLGESYAYPGDYVCETTRTRDCDESGKGRCCARPCCHV
jgi:hypothetical protein